MITMSDKKTGLPKIAEKRLMPYIEKGIQNGVFTDSKPVLELFKNKARDPSLKETIDSLGGIKSEMAQRFVTDCVLTDLSAILRQKRYLAHMDIWEVSHRTVGIAKGNPRPVVFIHGQATVESEGAEMESALFRMSLWDEDAPLADDVVRDGTYAVSVSCRNLDAETLDLRPLSGLTAFREEEYTHPDRAEAVKEVYEVVPISELEDDISRSPNDLRLIEATVSYSGVQTAKSGNTFGKMLLKDDSTMTMDAIESGETLLLNCLCSTDIAQRFGKYSRVLALVSTRMNGEYGLSANLDVALGLVTVAPPKVEAPTAGDDKEDDAADYFKDDTPMVTLDDDEDDDSDSEEAVVVDDDDEDVDLSTLPVKVLKQMAKAAGHSNYSDMKKGDLIDLLNGPEDQEAEGHAEEAEEAPAKAEAATDSDDDDGEDDWDDWD